MLSNLLGIDIPTTPTEDGLNIIAHDTLRRVVRNNPRLNVSLKPLTLSPQMCVFEATAEDTDTSRKETEVGESNPKSLKTEISLENPATMAYYRAYDRALIQLLDLPEGKVYSNNEIPKYKPAVPTAANVPATTTATSEATPKTAEQQPKPEPKKEQNGAENKEKSAKPKALKEAYGCKICEQGGKIIIYDIAKKSWIKHADGKVFTFDSEEKAVLALKQREAKKTAAPAAQPESTLPDDTVIAFGKFKGKKLGDVKNTNEFKEFVSHLKDSPVSYGDGVQDQVDAIKKMAV